MALENRLQSRVPATNIKAAAEAAVPEGVLVQYVFRSSETPGRLGSSCLHMVALQAPVYCMMAVASGVNNVKGRVYRCMVMMQSPVGGRRVTNLKAG